MGRDRRRSPRRDEDVGADRQKLRDQRRYPFLLSLGVAFVKHKVAAENISTLGKPLPQAAEDDGFVLGRTDPDDADPRNLCLLRPRGERPCRCGAAERRDERAPSHSITSSAAASTVGGISIPSALAVLRLTMVLNLVACSIGMSPGFAPLRILSTKVAA